MSARACWYAMLLLGCGALGLVARGLWDHDWLRIGLAALALFEAAAFRWLYRQRS